MSARTLNAPQNPPLIFHCSPGLGPVCVCVCDCVCVLGVLLLLLFYQKRFKIAQR